MGDEVICRTTGMWAATLDKLTADYEKYGIRFRRQISKTILRKSGAWASLAFVFQDLDVETNEYGGPQLMLATFRISGGKYVRNSYYIVKDSRESETIRILAKKVFGDCYEF